MAAALAFLAGCENSSAPAGPSGETVRFATFNAYLNRPTEGALIADLKTPDNAQAQKVAEIIQRAAPDVLLLSEFDYDEAGEALRLFRDNYLGHGWNGAEPAVYPYAYIAPSNTGLASGHDLDRDGVVTSEPGSREYGGDAFGYGEFPGQYAFVLLSKYPIDEAGVRTLQKFLWKDMPGAMLPDDPATPEPDDWYSAAALADFRLSSKNHWDVPVIVGEKRVHVLASHPTPPSFDGDEDRNGKRNHDEIRLWADYISSSGNDYIYDDKGEHGGLKPGERFVVMGDLNADPNDAGAVPGAIAQLLLSPAVTQAPSPMSKGGAVQAVLQGGVNTSHKGDPAEDTADFGDDPDRGSVGNLHLDYVLFSKAGLREQGSGVFWPGPDEAHYDLVGPGFPVESSDHRLVWRDLQIVSE
ncbi:endonuclease/exonuclease/phosphatase family protein [Hyphococcus sp.]|uniref:endonuclease/exonuclease/phosphatase family protein n=1 Tax=Hyphococcus sp. TaxID=2038636 RepID=UPI00207DCFBD|nr:MAG: endonuclease [Marinicaulis sp.]